MGKKEIVTGLITAAAEFISSENGQRFLCGTYSDGTTRSIFDSLNEEYISPKDRERWEKKKAKKLKEQKKTKKKSRKKGKKKQKDLDIFRF